MDQCLSVVDSGRQTMSKPQLKVKTLVDIYATAKGCTLEDLDKRNGTKWAVVSSYSNQVVSDDKPNKGKKRSLLRVGNEEGIGPVYIDAKGQKLRILSELASDPSREYEEDVSQKKKHSNEGQGKRLWGKKHYWHCKVVPQSKKLTVRKSNVSEIPEYQRGYSEECRGMERSETPGTNQRRILNQRILARSYLSRNENKKWRSICDQPSENEHSLSEDPLVLRGSSHVSVDLSETVSTSLNRQNSWKSCGEIQVPGKITKSRLICSVDKVFASAPKSLLKLKKARLDLSENENEDSGRWDSEMTQERELTDSDDIEETDEGWEDTSNNNVGYDNMLDKTNDPDAMFESMIHEKTTEGGSSFLEADLIPIPGPPGSFLPSPWDMETDATENHVNSSVITSQFQSSLDQLDLTDRYSSQSPLSAFSNFAAPETQTFRENDQSCCCQRKANIFEDAIFGRPAPHMKQQILDILSKSVPKNPSVSNPVLRLMGKDLMIINQREEGSHGDSCLKPTSQFHNLSKTQQVSVHLLHCPYNIP
ncbi:Hapless 8 [Hirschfeldia incana]|nr:Hapless 8 [Hirschfeldia incana]